MESMIQEISSSPLLLIPSQLNYERCKIFCFVLQRYQGQGHEPSVHWQTTGMGRLDIDLQRYSHFQLLFHFLENMAPKQFYT